MGDTYLDKGQMLTGKFGRRYMVRQLLESKDMVQVYEIAESGKIYMAVAVACDSARYRAEFVEPISEMVNSDAEYIWPEDTFSFTVQNKKCVGYVVKDISSKGYKPFSSVKGITDEEKKNICFGLTKAISKLHTKGFVYNEVPSLWVNDKKNVCLVGLPVKANTKFTTNDNLATRGISAPELFSVGVVKEASVYTDQFMVTSCIFRILIGLDPFVKITNDPNYAYARFSFSKEVEDPIEDYGFDKVDAWNRLSDLQKAMFIKTFTAGVTNPLARFSEEDWARTFKEFL